MKSYQVLSLISCAIVGVISASKVLVDQATRNQYFAEAPVWFPDQEDKISTMDMYNGPDNKYGFKTFQSIDCDFVEPSADDPIGGTTPKFMCEYDDNGTKVQLKIKYDQQYNSVLKWGRGNEEVYATVISQRILWALGFGTDQVVPVSVTCHNCPIEPWTYVQAVQGYDSEDEASGWMDMELIKSGKWNQTVPKLTLSSAVVYFKFNDYNPGDEIDYYEASDTNVTHAGFPWNDLFTYVINDETQMTARNALSVIAAFISHCDNFDENQGFICLDKTDDLDATKTKTSCKGTPFAYIHDVGGTLGYGWKLTHLNFWPDYMDLTQWLELSTWGNIDKCQVHVNGIPGCSWNGNLSITPDGLAMAARLLGKLTSSQITDLFTASRVNLMRGDSVNDWIAGFTSKLQKDILNAQCSA